jgi:hypothetical protein
VTRLSGQVDAVADQRDAISKLEGYPKAPTFIGSAIRNVVPQTYSEGALGWTAHLCPLVESEDGTTATLSVPDDAAMRLQGRSTTVSGRIVTVDLASADAPTEPTGDAAVAVRER